MKRYDKIQDNQFNDNSSNSASDEPSGEKSNIIGMISIIISGIISFVAAKFSGDNWTIGIIIMALCLVALWIYNHMSKNPSNIIKWQNHLKTLFRLGVAIFCMVLTIYIWRIISSTSNKDSNTAASVEQSPVTGIPIVVDLSFHSTHELYQNNSINGHESRPVIQMSRESFMRCLRSVSQGEIKGDYYQRYRGDGEQQLLAIVQEATDYEKTDENNLYGTIWYVDKYGPREFDGETKEYIWPYQFFF